MRIGEWVLVLLTLMLCTGGLMGSGSVPLGAADSYPTETSPIGWRGDGSGYWPGATPVADWDSETGRNILWRTPMPGIALAQPIVLGNLVITIAEPNLLLCVNAHDGEVVWRREVDHTSVMNDATRAAARREIDFLADIRARYATWHSRVEMLLAILRQKGVDPACMYRAAGGCGSGQADGGVLYRPQAGEPLAAVHKQVMKDRQVAHMFTDAWREQEEHGFSISEDPALAYGKHWAHIQSACQAYDLWSFGPWRGYASWPLATPCSDGERIYYAGANGQVAAYGLDGSRVWLVWDHAESEQAERAVAAGGIASPLLVNGALVVVQHGRLKVYDKATGEVIWSRVQEGRDTADPQSPLAVPLPMHMGVPLNDGWLDLLLDGRGHVMRLADGAMLAQDGPCWGAGQAVAVHEDICIHAIDEGASRPMVATRVVAESRDRLHFEVLWRNASDGPSVTPALVPDEGMWLAGKGWFRLESGTLAAIPEGGDGASAVTVGGGVAIVFGAYGASSGPGSVRQGLVYGHAYRVPTATMLSGRGINRPVVRDGREVSRDPADREYAQAYRWIASAGAQELAPTPLPCFHANRMFFRTPGYLWCIGDPTEPFPANRAAPPLASVPSASEVALALRVSGYGAASPARVSLGLRDREPRVRLAAVERARALGELGNGLVTTLDAMVLSDPQVKLRVASCEALIRCRPAESRKRFVGWLARCRGDVTQDRDAFLMTQALRGLSPATLGSLLPAVLGEEPLPCPEALVVELLQRAGTEAAAGADLLVARCLALGEDCQWDGLALWLHALMAVAPGRNAEVDAVVERLGLARLALLGRGGSLMQMTQWLDDIEWMPRAVLLRHLLALQGLVVSDSIARVGLQRRLTELVFLLEREREGGPDVP